MQQTTIFLIRHGKVDNPTNTIYDGTIHLSQEGREDMCRLGQILANRGERPVAIYSSDYIRTMQSSEELVKSFPGIPIIPRHELRDTYAPLIVGKSLDWLRPIVNEIYTAKEFRHLAVERPRTIINRIKKVIDEVKKSHEGETCFIVGHRDPFAFALWKEMYPTGKLPLLSSLNGVTWLDKSEAWKVVYDTGGKVAECELIRVEERLIAGEREC